jgi:hypothetical protein
MALDDQAKRTPILSQAAELAGNLTTGGLVGQSLGLGAKAAQMATAGKFGLRAAEGAVAGGVSAAGYTSGALSDRAKAALLGTAAGGALGGATGISPRWATAAAGAGLGIMVADNTAQGAAIGGTVGYLTPALMKRLVTPQGVSAAARGRQLLAEAIVTGAGSIDGAIAQAQKMAAAGATPLVLDVGGEAGYEMGRAATSLRTPAQQGAIENIIGRQAEQGPRMIQTIMRKTRFGLDNAHDAGVALQAARKAHADEFYARAHVEEVAVTPELKRLLSHPDIRQGYEDGKILAELDDFAGTAHPGAAKVSALTFDEKTGALTNEKIAIRGLDYLKRALDKRAEAAAGAGSAIDRAKSRPLGELADRIRDEAAKQSTAYTQALSTYRSDAAAMDALELAKGFRNKPPEIVRRERGALATQTERDLYTMGALQDLRDQIGQMTAEAPDVARRVLGGRVHGTWERSTEQRLRAIFDDPGVASDVMDYVRAEARISYGTAKFGGSRTAPMLTAINEMEGMPTKGNILRQTAGTFLSGQVDRAKAGWSSAVANEITNGQMMGANGLGELVTYLNSLRPVVPRGPRPAVAIATGAEAGKLVAKKKPGK